MLNAWGSIAIKHCQFSLNKGGPMKFDLFYLFSRVFVYTNVTIFYLLRHAHEVQHS